MNGLLFQISFAGLCALYLLESWVLMELVQQARASSRSAHKASDVNQTDAPVVPPFRLRVLGSDREITHGDVLGASSAVLFMDASSSDYGMAFDTSASIVNYLRDKVDGRVYLVCSGSEAECQTSYGHLSKYFQDDVQILLDPMRELAARMKIESSSAAVLIDSYGNVFRSGRYAPELSSRATATTSA